MHGHKLPTFLAMKKKLEEAGEVDGWMNPCLRASLMYPSMVFCYGIDRG